MKRFLLGALVTLFASTAIAQMTPPGRPFASATPTLGEQFDTLFITCGTAMNPTCPRTLPALERPVLLHYIAAGGRSPDTCSAAVYVQREMVASFTLLRLVFAADTVDNVTLALPQPIRLQAGDVIAVGRQQGNCAILATLGIEYLE
jgi:hypothetical protein